VAEIANMFVQINNSLDEDEDPNVFNEHKFEAMNTKYLHILDTDYKNYLVVYSCQENQEFSEDRTERELMPEDVFKAYVNQRSFDDT